MAVARSGLLLTAMMLTGSALAAEPMHFDTAHSRFGFEIRTRLGQRMEGVFPRFEGWITELPDGRHRVRLRMFTQYVEIPDKQRYTSWMRGGDFFDAARYPVVEFDSDPYSPELARYGGSVAGNLTIRGVSRRETMYLAKPECDNPGYDCDLVSRGNVSRSQYGMDAWQMALSDRVIFVLRTRLKSAPKP